MMGTADLYLSLGSNIGDREKNLRRAVSLLDERLGHGHIAVSSVIETKAWKFDGDNFLNCAALYRLPMPETAPEQEAFRILRICKDIEKEMGRTDREEYGPDGERIYHSRIIDIDILFYGNEIIETRELIIPHKDIADRPFVTVPLSEIARPRLKKFFKKFFEQTA